MIWLDNAATTLRKPPTVPRAVATAVGELADPGRGGHKPAIRGAETAFACREAAARLFHVPEPEQVVFTMNATHGLNIAIKSLAGPRERVVISGYEHNAVLRPLRAIGAEIVVAVSPLFDRAAALAVFDEALTPETSLCVVNAVSNVFGFVLPFEEIAALCRQRGIPLIVDASQAAGHMPLDFAALGASFIAMPGHKGLYGPQGTGLLLCGEAGKTLLEGGSGSDSANPMMPDFLPDRHEAGTHNMPGVAGLLEGLCFVESRGIERISQYEFSLLRETVAQLRELEELTLYTAPTLAEQAPVLSFTARGWDSQELAEALSRRGIAVRAGLHCAPLAHQTAGTFPGGTVRLSFSVFNRPEELRRLRAVLKELLRSRPLVKERKM